MAYDDEKQAGPEADRILESLLIRVAKARAELDGIGDAALLGQGDDLWILPDDTVLGLATQIQAARQARTRHMPAALFGEPAWDLLLALSAAKFSGRDVSKSEACSLAAAPRSTVGRWLAALEKAGVVERVRSSGPGPRTLFRLSDDGTKRMVNLLSAVAHQLSRLR